MGSIIIDDKTFASSDITIPVPSATTQSLIALSQDITALLSLSIETTASIVYDAYRKAIGAIGLGEVVAQRATNCTGPGGEASRGLAVVVVGAGEGVSAYTGSPPSPECGHTRCILMNSYWSFLSATPRKIWLYRFRPSPPSLTQFTAYFGRLVITPAYMVTHTETSQAPVPKPSRNCRADNYRPRD